MNFTDTLPFLTALFAVCVSIGGLLAIRQGYSKRVGEIQESVIKAQKTQNDIQKEQIAVLEQEVTRLKHILTAVRYGLKRQGFTIEINDDFVSLVIEQPSKRTRTIQIPIVQVIEEDEKKSTSEDT